MEGSGLRGAREFPAELGTSLLSLFPLAVSKQFQKNVDGDAVADALSVPGGAPERSLQGCEVRGGGAWKLGGRWFCRCVR
jgi:hypothetical protein